MLGQQLRRTLEDAPSITSIGYIPSPPMPTSNRNFGVDFLTRIVCNALAPYPLRPLTRACRTWCRLRGPRAAAVAATPPSRPCRRRTAPGRTTIRSTRGASAAVAVAVAEAEAVAEADMTGTADTAAAVARRGCAARTHGPSRPCARSHPTRRGRPTPQDHRTHRVRASTR